MDRTASTIIATGAIAVLIAGAALPAFCDAPRREAGAPPSTSAARALQLSVPAAAAWPASSSPRSPPAASVPAAALGDGLLVDEPTLMDTLRDLRGSDPSLTLQLARQGNHHFKDSAGAAERSWFIVKALSDLGRHDEARREGRVLVDKFTKTRWAQDVYRHVFVNPATHPFERGYGEKFESGQ
jgi:hypothetical protein